MLWQRNLKEHRVKNLIDQLFKSLIRGCQKRKDKEQEQKTDQKSQNHIDCLGFLFLFSCFRRVFPLFCHQIFSGQKGCRKVFHYRKAELKEAACVFQEPPCSILTGIVNKEDSVQKKASQLIEPENHAVVRQTVGQAQKENGCHVKNRALFQLPIFPFQKDYIQPQKSRCKKRICDPRRVVIEAEYIKGRK